MLNLLGLVLLGLGSLASSWVAPEETGYAVLFNGVNLYILRAWAPGPSSPNYLKGLTNIHELPLGWAWAIDWGEEVDYPFWMKDCYIPLTLVCADAQGLVVDVHRLTPLSEESYTPGRPYRYAVEIEQGVLDIKPGWWLGIHRPGSGHQVPRRSPAAAAPPSSYPAKPPSPLLARLPPG